MRTKGSTNQGKQQKGITVKFRISKEFLDHVDDTRLNNMFGKSTRSKFIIDALKYRILHASKDFRQVDQNLLEQN